MIVFQVFPDADALMVTWWGDGTTELFDYRHICSRDEAGRPLRVLTPDGQTVLLTYRRDGRLPVAASLGFVLWEKNLPDVDKLRLIFDDNTTTGGPTP